MDSFNFSKSISDLDPGKDWGQEEKAATEDEIIGWHQWLNGSEFEQTPGDGEGQGSLVTKSWTGLRDGTTYPSFVLSYSQTEHFSQHCSDTFLFTCSHVYVNYTCIWKVS